MARRLLVPLLLVLGVAAAKDLSKVFVLITYELDAQQPLLTHSLEALSRLGVPPSNVLPILHAEREETVNAVLPLFQQAGITPAFLWTEQPHSEERETYIRYLVLQQAGVVDRNQWVLELAGDEFIVLDEPLEVLLKNLERLDVSTVEVQVRDMLSGKCGAAAVPFGGLDRLIAQFPCGTKFSSLYLGTPDIKLALHTGESRNWHGGHRSLGNVLNARGHPLLLQLAPKLYQERFLTQAKVRRLRSATIPSIFLYRFRWTVAAVEAFKRQASSQSSPPSLAVFAAAVFSGGGIADVSDCPCDDAEWLRRFDATYFPTRGGH